MRTKQAIWEVFTGLGLVAAMLMAAQPMMQPLHMLLHHSSHAVQEHAGCGHDAYHDVEADQGMPKPALASVEDTPSPSHADCRVCKLLSIAGRYKALDALQDLPANESASAPVSVAGPSYTSAKLLAASGRAPPVVAG